MKENTQLQFDFKKIVQKKLVMALESPFKWIIMLTQSN